MAPTHPTLGTTDNGNVETAVAVASKPKRSWKKYAIIGGVLTVAIIAAIVVAVTVPKDDEATGFGLNDVLGSAYRPSAFNGSWGAKNALNYFNPQGDIVSMNPDTGVETVLLPYFFEGVKDVSDFSVSADSQFVMLRFEQEPKFRHSAESFYVAVELSSRQRTNISLTGAQTKVQLVVWSPRGNGLVFVENNNLVYKSSVTAEAIRITSGLEPHIYNGISDWIYEEEILSTNKAVWFSPDGKHISFVRFDDNSVRHMLLPKFGEPGTIESQYPTELELDYPKPGTANPTVRLYTVDLEATTSTSVNTVEISAPAVLSNVDHIILGVSWRNADNVVSMWANRVQNYSIIQTCQNAICRNLLEISQPNGWIESDPGISFNALGNQMALVLFASDSTNGQYAHIHIVDVDSGSKVAITSGPFNVQRIVKWETNINRVFYIGNDYLAPHQSHLYVAAPFLEPAVAPQCLTCKTQSNGVDQTVFSAVFSAESQHFVLSTLGPSVPRHDIYAYTLTDGGSVDIRQVRSLDTNEHIHEALKGVAQPTVTHLQVELNSDTLKNASVKMTAPANLDTSGKTKYPLLIHVYGGPNLFVGTGQWGVGWASYLASNKSVIVVQIDGRGSGRRDAASLFAGYRNLGTVEIEDQLKVAEILATNYKYIDSERVGIWGRSYGGYASAMALVKDTKHQIKCAASLAPVTDWLFYDTMYTERYMGLVQDNPSGYKESSLITQVENLRNKTLFLVHGTLDDNVHYQQSMELARALEVNDIAFTQMSYPDEDHALLGVTRHLYHELNRYFGKCFNMELN